MEQLLKLYISDLALGHITAEDHIKDANDIYNRKIELIKKITDKSVAVLALEAEIKTVRWHISFYQNESNRYRLILKYRQLQNRGNKDFLRISMLLAVQQQLILVMLIRFQKKFTI